MKIIDPNAGTLLNVEVLKKLRSAQKVRERQAKNKHQKPYQPWIEKQVQAYLAQTPAGKQDAELVEQVLQDLSLTPLSSLEKVIILNNRPESEVELHMTLESAEQRFTDQQLTDLLKYIREALPAPAPAPGSVVATQPVPAQPNHSPPQLIATHSPEHQPSRSQPLPEGIDDMEEEGGGVAESDSEGEQDND